MQSEFIELIKVVGTFALLVIIVVVLMLFVSILDRHPRAKSEPRKDKDAKPQKRF
jgi:hypothetical protein